MIRNSIIYRRIWYIKRRNSKRLYIYFRLLSIVIILLTLAFYAENYSVPFITHNIEQKIHDTIKMEVNKAISEVLYEDADADASIGVMSDADTEKLDELAWKVSQQLKERLAVLDNEVVELPVGVLFGNTILAKSGPLMKFEPKLIYPVESHLKSEKTILEGKRLKYTLYINVRTKLGIKLLLNERELDIKSNYIVIENILSNTAA